MNNRELLQIIEQASIEQWNILDFSGKGLTALPPEIGKFSILAWLILKNNQLQTLPAEIGQLTNLIWLDLSKNQLQTLPPEISQLTNLKWLDLSNNQLQARPPEISQLTNLEQLLISNNQLHHQISMPPGLKSLTDTYESWKGELQYAFYVFPSNNPELDVDVSLVEEWSRLAIAQEFVGTGRGKRLSVEDFLGNCRFDMFEAQAQGKDGKSVGGVVAGYEFAFTQPPYGLRAKTVIEIFHLFDQINALVLGPVTDANLIIYEWDTTGLNYFINDWWDFLWTVWSHAHKHLVVIYGSTTD